MDEPLILNRYRLIERLAAGGTAEVWRAHDEQLDRPVAVKRLHPHLLPDEASRRRLAAEARAAAGLSHPTIVSVYDADVEGAAPVLVMELVEGEPLSSRIARGGPLAPRDAAAMTADLAEALFHAHQQGVIHRDMKPGNVLLARDGRTRLVDFGIAHSLADSSERLTQTGTVIGTLASMAPEQLAAGPITPRTDLYGLGAVLHEALTGRPPYPSSTPLVLAEAQRAGAPPLEGVDPALAGLVAACLAYDPANRPLHAGALAIALRDWLAGDSSTALGMAPLTGDVSTVDTSAMTQPVDAVAAPAPDPSVDRSTSGDGRGLPLWAVVVTAGVLLLAIGLAVMQPWRTGDDLADVPSSPTQEPTPATTPVPEWLAELTAEVAEACGPDTASELQPELASLGEDAADERADVVIEACEEANDDDGQGQGRGNDRGNRGNGGNGGRGNDD